MVSAIVGVSSVQAADLPVRAYTKAPVVEVAPSWSGFYVGATVGGAWSKVDPTFSDPGNVAFPICGPCNGPFDTTTIDQTGRGVIGGAHAGYNWQFSPNFLLGIEGDFTGTNLRHRTDARLTSVGVVLPVSNLGYQTDINWLASIRGRLGYVNGNWMVYGTGGVAFAKFDFTGSESCDQPTCNPVFANSSINKARTGWTAGAGTEWAFASGWRARAEYLYYEFDSTDTTSTLFVNDGGAPFGCGAGLCNAVFSVGKIDIHTLRVGLSYAFR